MKPIELIAWLTLEKTQAEHNMARVDEVAGDDLPPIDWALPQIVYYDAVRKYLEGAIARIRKTGRIF